MPSLRQTAEHTEALDQHRVDLVAQKQAALVVAKGCSAHQTDGHRVDLHRLERPCE